jgi:hypothetical protein
LQELTILDRLSEPSHRVLLGIHGRQTWLADYRPHFLRLAQELRQLRTNLPSGL